MPFTGFGRSGPAFSIPGLYWEAVGLGASDVLLELNNARKFCGIEARSSHQCPIDIWLPQEARDIQAGDRPSIQDPSSVRDAFIT